MKRLSAAVVIVAAAFAAGCSSSVDNPPDVGPTNPTTGNGLPPGPRPRRPRPPQRPRCSSPRRASFPSRHDLYFSGTTDGTINIQPANGLIPNQAGSMRSTAGRPPAPIRIRFGGALNPASFSAANIRVYQVTVSNTNKAVSGFTRPLDVRHRVLREHRHRRRRRQHHPGDPAAGAAGAISWTRSADRPAAARYRIPGGAHQRHPDGEWCRGHGRPRLRHDQDHARGPTINPANCATLPNAPMQGACGFTASHLAVAANPALGPLALNPANIIVSFHFSTLATRDTLRALGLMIFNPAAPVPAIGVNAPPGIPLNMINPALPANRDRALRHGHRALLLLHSDGAGAGRHQHRFTGAAPRMDRGRRAARAAR